MCAEQGYGRGCWAWRDRSLRACGSAIRERSSGRPARGGESVIAVVSAGAVAPSRPMSDDVDPRHWQLIPDAETQCESYVERGGGLSPLTLRMSRYHRVPM
jgi:hypothetical protein